MQLIIVNSHYSQQSMLALHMLLDYLNGQCCWSFAKANPNVCKFNSTKREYLTNVTQVSGILKLKHLQMFHGLIS